MGRRVVIGLAAALALALGAVAAQAAGAVPKGVSSAVDRWTATGLHIQDSKILPGAKQVGAAAAAAHRGCAYPQSRAGLAAALGTFAGGLHTFVVNTERGELRLYKLAPQLGAKHSAQRRAYVKLLDHAGRALDFELADVKSIRANARAVTGACVHSLDEIGTDVAVMMGDHVRVDKALKALRSRFG